MVFTKRQISEKIKEDHLSIKSLTQQIRQHIKKDVSDITFESWLHNLNDLIQKLQHKLIEHFEMEEEGGFMADILSIAPQKRHAISQLKSEHEMMLKDVKLILRCVSEAHTIEETKMINLTHRIRELLDLLTTHEAAENILLEDTYLRDEGISG